MCHMKYVYGIITVPNIKYLKSRPFSSFIYNTFTIITTHLQDLYLHYKNKTTTNKQTEEDSGNSIYPNTYTEKS